jgi:hypothetical protein
MVLSVFEPPCFSIPAIANLSPCGKQPDGWMMPPSSPTSVTQQMIRVIEEKIDHVIWKINSRHRRSDSVELSSSTTEVSVKASAPAIAKNMIPF